MSTIQQKLTSGTLKAWWNYPSGSYSDLAGTMDGVASGTPYFNREGLQLDGVADFVTTGSLNIASQLTLVTLFSAYTIDHAGGGGVPRVLDKTGSYGMYVANATGLLVTFTTGVSDEFQSSTTTIPLMDDVVGAMTFDATGGERKVFINGLLESTETGLTGTITSNANDVIIGDNTAANMKFHGGVSTVLIFEETLTELEVAQVTSELINKTY